jgi:multiple antibiotic resistance protein
MWWFGDFLYDFLVIWIVIDPIRVLPVFTALTASYDAPTRRRMAKVTVLVSLLVLAFFISLGQIIIAGMGISLHAFVIAGGVILFLFAVDLVSGQDKPIAVDAADTPMQLAISPLAIPTLAGPGAMLTVVLRTDNSRVSLLEQIHTAAAVALVLAITYGLLLVADPISRAIGAGGANVIKRIMGMILAAYAVTLVLQGLGEWLHLPTLWNPQPS